MVALAGRVPLPGSPSLLPPLRTLRTITHSQTNKNDVTEELQTHALSDSATCNRAQAAVADAVANAHLYPATRYNPAAVEYRMMGLSHEYDARELLIR